MEQLGCQLLTINIINLDDGTVQTTFKVWDDTKVLGKLGEQHKKPAKAHS